MLETLPKPKDVLPPSISGTTQEGETLTTTTGTWEDSPTSYAYQWEDCNEAGASCSSIAGATSSTLLLKGGDVGHTIVSTVKATNATGATKVSSAPSGVVSAKEEKSKGGPTNCFENPESEGSARFEACGYPGPKNTAVQNCSELPKTAGSMTITTDGETIENTTISGQVVVEASGVTLHHDCVIVNGAGTESAIHMEGSATKFQLSDSTVRAENAGSAAFEEAVSNNDPAAGTALISGDVLEDCGECLHGNFEANNSYLIANAKLGDSGIHRETWYANNGTVIAHHDTMLVPEDQTAIVFDNVANGVEHIEECTNHVTIEESLMAGSGQMIQTCGPRANGAGSASLTVRNNRFARCLTTPIVNKKCSGGAIEGSDSHGYFPEGGWISLLGDAPYGTLKWEGNFWDDDLKTASD